jgi:hypothetical protein
VRKNNVAGVLLFVFVWLLLGVGGFSLVESRGIILKLGFSVVWLVILPPAMVYVLKVIGLSKETSFEQKVTPRKRIVFLLIFVLVWAIGTIFTLNLLKLSAVVETLTYIASVLGLVAIIYLVETRGSGKSES